MSNNENEKHAGSLNRRDLLKVVTLASGAALAPEFAARAATAAVAFPPPAPQGEAPVAPGYKPKALNPHEWKTLRVLSDIIIPADERSGSATQAGVPELIDEWLAARGGEMKTQLVGGMAWLDAECNRAYGNDFVDCTSAQQTQMLGRIAWPAKAAAADSNGVAFFNRLRGAVMGGFYTSKMGIADLQYMGNKMVEDWTGCPESCLSALDVNYSDWQHWKS
ncbi:MAG: gluconate 2-dehydrogenase subunit 3 family protein [Terriglobia bacterium]